jgi:hypothetical protein
MGTPVPLSAEDWSRVRYEYESTHRKVFEICAEHGISAGTLRDRVRRWGWKRRWSGPVPRQGPPPMAVSIIEAHAPESSPGDPVEDFEELRADLKRRIDAIIEEERQERPRRYLAAWEEFAAQAPKPTPQRRRPLSRRPAGGKDESGGGYFGNSRVTTARPPVKASTRPLDHRLAAHMIKQRKQAS